MTTDKRSCENCNRHNGCGEEYHPKGNGKCKIGWLRKPRWRCQCGHTADFILNEKYPKRRGRDQSYIQCAKCHSDVDTW